VVVRALSGGKGRHGCLAEEVTIHSHWWIQLSPVRLGFSWATEVASSSLLEER